ncbi:mediator of RNA polymerase II transcription subunit 31 [Xylariomycetidae sp. FL2044]|nr:mediator of RNA polymerase II transcription subunit 31 [Xylariomycetidae sp. FL2044]
MSSTAPPTNNDKDPKDPKDPMAGQMITAENEPKYGGYSRFEIELEFVQSLANPYYLNFLASQKYFSEPRFVNYLKYLLYWTKPPYLKYLNYPGPTIKNLELLQEEKFRQDILSPELTQTLAEEGAKAAVDWHKKEG